MKIMLLRLEGVLQSWGERSRWDHRDSTEMPTKSGVIGLLGCAMGLSRGDKRLCELAGKLTMAVRADRIGTQITDYQTVQGRCCKLPNAENSATNRKDTIITPREYLQDACYTVFLTGDDALLQACCDALYHPVWVPCLGRRSCPPSRPLLPLLTDEYASLDDAVKQFRWERPPVDRMSEWLRAEVEDSNGERERSDQPVNSSIYAYRKRRVRIWKTEVKQLVHDLCGD